MILEKKRIFIFEDNIANRSLMQVILEQNGAKVMFERWGIDYYEKIHSFAPIDIIILDLMYPNNVTGYDIFDQLRTLSEVDQVPIVAVSAADASVALPKTKEMGFAGYISKPIDLMEFPKQIRKIIEGTYFWSAF